MTHINRLNAMWINAMWIAYTGHTWSQHFAGCDRLQCSEVTTSNPNLEPDIGPQPQPDTGPEPQPQPVVNDAPWISISITPVRLLVARPLKSRWRKTRCGRLPPVREHQLTRTSVSVLIFFRVSKCKAALWGWAFTASQSQCRWFSFTFSFVLCFVPFWLFLFLV